MTTYKDCINACRAEKQRYLGDDLQRPMTQYESQIVYGLFSFSAFVDFAREVMAKRNRHIKRATARLGLIKWACRSLYQDYIDQLTPEGCETFRRRAPPRPGTANASTAQRRAWTRASASCARRWTVCSAWNLEATATAGTERIEEDTADGQG